MKDPIVKVRTRCPISEDAVMYPAGSVFETTLERAMALGDSVTILVGAKTGKKVADPESGEPENPEAVDEEPEGEEPVALSTESAPAGIKKGKSGKGSK